MIFASVDEIEFLHIKTNEILFQSEIWTFLGKRWKLPYSKSNLVNTIPLLQNREKA